MINSSVSKLCLPEPEQDNDTIARYGHHAGDQVGKEDQDYWGAGGDWELGPEARNYLKGYKDGQTSRNNVYNISWQDVTGKM